MDSDRKEAQPGLTAADLDRLAALHEAAQVGECSYEPNGTTLDGTEVGALLIAGGRATYIMAAPGRYAAALLNNATALLALARRGLEAEDDADSDAMIEARAAANEVAYSRGFDAGAEDHGAQLAAALAEVERVRGRLEKAEAGLKDFVEWGLRADLHPTRCVSSVSEALRTEQEYLDNIDAMVRERARDALASAAAQTKAVKVELAPHRAECEGGENCICQRRPRPARPAAPKGGPG